MSGFPSKMRTAFGESDASDAQTNFRLVAVNIRKYVALKTVISLGTGVGVAVWLSIVGVDFPLLWGLLAFLLNYIPNIGSFIAAIPAVLLAFLQLGFGSTLAAAGGYLVINLVMANILEPRVMGYGVGLSTLVVFVSLIFWGWVLGPVGMLLSVPLTVIFRIVLETNDSTKWVAVLLGSERSAVAEVEA
jgi:predicted PurR-regulated permease PerM